MARRRRKTQNNALALGIFFALIVLLLAKTIAALGVVVIGISALAAGIIVWIKRNRRKARLLYLSGKYDEESALRIMQKTYWIGQTSEQLIDSLGEPDERDDRVSRTIRREIWKYRHKGANRYGLRITLDHGVVAGWDDKN